MAYWLEGSSSTATSPTSSSDIVGQHNNIVGIDLQADLKSAAAFPLSKNTMKNWNDVKNKREWSSKLI